MGGFNAEVGKRTDHMETTTGKFGLELRNKRGNTLVEWVTSRKYKIMSAKNGVAKTEIDYNPLIHQQTGYEQHQTGRRGGKKPRVDVIRI